VHAVVEQHLLGAGPRVAELATVVGVLDRDGQRHLRGVDAGAAHAHPPLHERAEHREEAPVGVLDVGEVAAVVGDHGVAVEKVGARDPHAVEPDPAVVDAVEADLRAAVLDPHARHRPALVVADAYDEGVHAVRLAAEHELGEHHGVAGVLRGVADVVLAGPVVGGVDDELAGLHVVRRGRAQRLHVGAVARLGHREAAEQPAVDQVLEVGVVVRLGAELEDRAAEQAELDTDLDHDGQVTERERLEGGHRRADVRAPAVLLREAEPGLARRRHHLDDVEHPLPELVAAHRALVVQDRGVLGEVGADEPPDLGVLPVEQGGQGGDIEDSVVGHGHMFPRFARPMPWNLSQRVTARSRPVRGARRSPGTTRRSSCSGRSRRCAGPR